MIVQCEKCEAKFRLEDDRVPEGGITGRCSKCRHVFFIEKPAAAAGDYRSVQGRKEGNETSFDLFHEHVPLRSKKYLVTGLLFVLIFILLIGGAWLFLHKFPDIRENAFTQSNIRRYFQSKRLPEKDIVFSTSKTRGYYIDNKNVGRIFVIEGDAINNSSGTKDFIQVKGTLFDGTGNGVAEKEVYCGNVLSEKELVELDGEQIRTRLGYNAAKPQFNMNLSPQKSIPFMIVFFDLPADLKEFGVESTDITEAAK